MDTYKIDSHGRAVIEKDPLAVLDYTFDFADYLQPIEDVIGSVVFTLGANAGSLLINSSSNTSTTATVWLSGGDVVEGSDPIKVDCQITTTSTPVARKDSRAIYIKMKDM
jgi:hypothetical protein